MKPIRILKERIGKYKDNILLNRLLTVLGIDILVKASGFLLLPLYLRLMTQEEYGLYGYLLSIVLTFSLVLNFGLYIPLSKFYHDYKDPADKGKFLFTIFFQLIILLFIVLFPVYFFRTDYAIVKILFKNSIAYDEYRFIILVAIIVSVFTFMLSNFFFTSEKIKQVKSYNILRIICINLFSLAFLYFFKERDSVQTRLEATYITELILFIVFAYYPMKEIWTRFELKQALYNLKMAFPVMLSAVFGIVINFSDKFFLEKYTSFKNLSTYFLAITCASIIPTIFASFQNAWLPLFFKEKDLQKNIARTNKMMSKLLLVFIALSFCIVLFIWIIVRLGIIQNKYEQVIFILPILLVTQIISAMTPLYSNYLVYFEKTYIVPVAGFFICFINLALSLSLIPLWGVYGAAFVAFLSNLLYLIIYYLLIKKYTQRYLLARRLLKIEQ